MRKKVIALAVAAGVSATVDEGSRVNKTGYSAVIRPTGGEDIRVRFLANGKEAANNRALSEAADLAKRTGVEHRVVRVEER